MPSEFLALLSSASNLLQVVIGFSLIIVIHELGHFLAARWAGIRVLAFAVGFGPALFSYRPGLGWRKGSSEAEYKARTGVRPDQDAPTPAATAISCTEYRLNSLPFGGYVRMLGQDDSDARIRSAAPDSFQSCKVWKRMIVISAGVVMNLILAAILFVVVFLIGLRVEPAKIGIVAPKSPAAKAIATNAAALHVTEDGLQPGDLITRIDGSRPADFNDIFLAAAMAGPGEAVHFEVEREGVSAPLLFNIIPESGEVSHMLELGVGPAASDTLVKAAPRDRSTFDSLLSRAGLTGVEPGARLVQIGGVERMRSVYELSRAVEASNGAPVPVVFENPGENGAPGVMVSGSVRPERELQIVQFRPDPQSTEPRATRHILGFLPLLRAASVESGSAADRAGIKAGDVFVQLGGVEWPSIVDGVAEIKRNAGRTIPIVVQRTDPASGETREVVVEGAKVSTEGTLGFNIDTSPFHDPRVTAWPAALVYAGEAAPGATPTQPPTPPAAALNLLRGSRILKVGDRSIATFNDLASALIDAAKSAGSNPGAAGEAVVVPLTVALPLKEKVTQTFELKIPAEEAKAVAQLGWRSPLEPAEVFELERVTQQAAGPLDAISLGLLRTKSVMTSTYVTFLRLFQGTVKVEHLKGPVGIAHIGTQVASRGTTWLLFFLALISVNLAVVNFLPLPIADGGHFIFLLYEQITGKPVSVAVQNGASIVGLALIVGMFLLVTFNDVSQLFGP